MGEVIGESATLGDFHVKHARVAGWAEVGGREAVLIERCTAGDDAAYAELVEEHQRMVVQLAVNLLGDWMRDALNPKLR